MQKDLVRVVLLVGKIGFKRYFRAESYLTNPNKCVSHNALLFKTDLGFKSHPFMLKHTSQHYIFLLNPPYSRLLEFGAYPGSLLT